MEAISQVGYVDPRKNTKESNTKMIQKLGNISYEMHLKECGLTTLGARSLRGDQI